MQIQREREHLRRAEQVCLLLPVQFAGRVSASHFASVCLYSSDRSFVYLPRCCRWNFRCNLLNGSVVQILLRRSQSDERVRVSVSINQ
ncbi:unnamed protein product [Hermetia illucens]|uniref:Uncharacterized protein n=1 Tax=Hermetia illucens TaxID=343691 RepID=A0A7R8UJ69_HERIL|nr:unnamed protein product [Hermetia illucens]